MKVDYPVDTYIIASVIISFLGFCLENVWMEDELCKPEGGLCLPEFW